MQRTSVLRRARRSEKSNDRVIYVHISYVITKASTLLGTQRPFAFTPSTPRYLCALISPFHRDFINAATNNRLMITHGLIHTFWPKCGPRGGQQGSGDFCNEVLEYHSRRASMLMGIRHRVL